jgi:glycosyltransferase involved in cell wall biosynthesis
VEKLKVKFGPRSASLMKLSIIIPAYNEELYLGDCLKSVIECLKKYSEDDVELIVVNNASTDRTVEVAQSFPRVKLVNESNKGLTNARRAGFMASGGELIANIDADVLMTDGWVEKVVFEFATNQRLVALSGPYIYYDKPFWFNTAVWSYYLVGYFIHLFNQHILHIGAMLQGGNFIIRRDALERAGGYNTAVQFYGEDTEMARRMQKVGKVKFTFALPMRTSGRRLSQEGVIKTAYRYVINFLSITFLKRPAKGSEYTFVGKNNKN